MHPATNAESDTGDVKYHKGYSGTRESATGKKVNVELVPNPSHLEVVNPVVQGIARARQRVPGSTKRMSATKRACSRSSCMATRRSPARASSPRR